MNRSIKFALIILIILANLHTLAMFSLIFYGTTESTFEKLTGKPTGALNICIDEWINLSQVEDQAIYIDEAYSIDINVTNEETYSILNFSDDTDLFDIDSNSGLISFTPTSSQIGIYAINITVSNLICDLYDDSMVFNLTVNRTNFAPILSISSNFTNLVEDVLFQYNISKNVTDPDGDALLFYDNTSLFNINTNTGVIAFIPDNDDVGNHSVKLTVSDGQLVDDQDIVFTIRNVNDPPELVQIGAQTAYINQTFELDISAYDIDPVDNLTFSSNTSWFFNMSGPNASVKNQYVTLSLTLNFTNFSQWNGTYSINVTVNDTNGTQDSEVISFTITTLNYPPNITSYYPLTKEFSLSKGNSQYFNITKEDPDGTTPSTTWYVNDVSSGTEDNFTWTTSDYTLGTYNVTVRITDGELDDAESWLITLVTPPALPTIFEGTSVGGGGFGGDVTRIICEELWICSDWSVCSLIGIQIRECEDLYKCGTILYKPNETRTCAYVEVPSCFDGVQNQNEVLVDCGGVCKPCPTCDDGIQNHGETDIDCGGPCPACKEIREPAKVPKLIFGSKGLFWDINRYWLVWLLISLSILSIARLSKHKKKKGIFSTIGMIFVYLKVFHIKRLLGKTKHLMKNNNVIKAKQTYQKAKDMYVKLPKEVAQKIKF